MKKAEELDTAIHMVLDSLLDFLMNDEADIMTAEDLDHIRVQPPALDNIFVTGFFKFIAYPLSFLRQCIFLHATNTVPENFPGLFKIGQ